MKKINLTLLTLISGLLFGCASSDQEQAFSYDKNNDPRIGQAVDRVCFSNAISGWGEVDNDPDGLLVHFGSNRTFKLDLIGMCEPDWAMTKVAFISRSGSNCLAKGDKVVTDSQRDRHSSCVVSAIHEWQPQVVTN